MPITKMAMMMCSTFRLFHRPRPDADAAGEHFGGDDDQPGGADRQADAGQHVGQHGREEDLGDNLHSDRLSTRRHVEVILGTRCTPWAVFQDHRPDRADEDGQVAAGSAFLKTIRPIGSQASGETDAGG